MVDAEKFENPAEKSENAVGKVLDNVSLMVRFASALEIDAMMAAERVLLIARRLENVSFDARKDSNVAFVMLFCRLRNVSNVILSMLRRFGARLSRQFGPFGAIFGPRNRTDGSFIPCLSAPMEEYMLDSAVCMSCVHMCAMRLMSRLYVCV